MGCYNKFIYCTDKTNDSTVKELLNLVKLKVEVLKYADMNEYITKLSNAKSAYQEIIDKGLMEEVADESKIPILEAVGTNDFYEFVEPNGKPLTPSTAVLYDDAINVFKNPKYKLLLDLLHQNRQPKITYFLCMQDGFALPPQIKRNLDTCIIFGGFNDTQMMIMLLRQLNSSSQNNQKLMEIYSRLSNREGLIFDYLPDRTTVRKLNE
jgi:hypothetical protein